MHLCIKRPGVGSRRDIIPYNPQLKQLARKLRSQMTLSEVLLWKSLKNRQMLGYDFHRQKPIDNYIVDFYCCELKLAIEVDGATHEEKEVMKNDKIRQEKLEKLGVRFLRFDALLILKNPQAAINEIHQWIEDFQKARKL